MSSSLVGALVGSAIAFVIGDAVGRKAELVGAGCLYATAAASMAAAPSLPLLIAARALYGVGIGLAMHAAPAYIAEAAPASVRGVLVSLKEAAIVGGILAGFVSGVVWSVDTEGAWR